MEEIKTGERTIDGAGSVFVSQGSSRRSSIFNGEKERAMKQLPITSHSQRNYNRNNFIKQQQQTERAVESQEFSTESKPMIKSLKVDSYGTLRATVSSSKPRTLLRA